MEIITTSNAPAAVGPYSQAIATDNFIFCSGQIALQPNGEMKNGDIAEQTEQVLQNLQAVLEAADSGLDKVVKTTVYLSDINDYSTMNEIYAKFFAASKPARAAFQVAALPKGARIEIEAIAQK